MKRPFLPIALLAPLALGLGACVLPDAAAKADTDTAAASKPKLPEAMTAAPEDDPVPAGQASHYKPTEGVARNPVTELLRKAQTELAAEQEARKRAETELAETRARLEETRNALSAARLETDSAKTARDVSTTNIRELSEKLVGAALARAEAERDALEAKIVVERALRAAADKGVVLEGFEGVEPPPTAAASSASESKSPPASRPAAREAKK